MDAIVSFITISDILTISIILQIYNLESKSALLELTSGTSYGYILIKEGEVWDAHLHDKRGSEALFAILQYDEGILHSQGIPSSITRTINAPLTALLLKAAQIEDEQDLNITEDLTIQQANLKLQSLPGFMGTVVSNIHGELFKAFPQSSTPFCDTQSFSKAAILLTLTWKELFDLNDAHLYHLYDQSNSLFILHLEGGCFYIIGVKSPLSPDKIASEIKKRLNICQVPV